MFKNKCNKCGSKFDKEFSFCPFCGYNIKKESDEKNYGLLGLDDEVNESTNLRMPFGFDKILGSLMKELDVQLGKLESMEENKVDSVEKKEKPVKKIPIKSNGISISISTATGKQPEIRISGFGPEFEKMQEPEKKQPKIEITEEQAKKFATLPRKEAESKMKRFANKLTYEIDIPGVTNLNDIIINQLESSIEIKALSEKNIYFKLLPVNMPIVGYKLKEGKLFLDLQA